MTPQYYSKKKKTERLSFTITPALKHQLIEFILEKQEKDPNNKEYKSLSSFCYHSIKDVLELKRKGIELKEYNSIPDKQTYDFYDKLSFKAIIPSFELGMALNKYNDE